MLINALYIIGAFFSIAGGIAGVVAAFSAKGFRDGAKIEREKIVSFQTVASQATIVNKLESFQHTVHLFAPGCTTRSLQGVDFASMNKSIREQYTDIHTECRRRNFANEDNAQLFTSLEQAVTTFCLSTNSEQRLDAGKQLYTCIGDISVTLKQQLDNA